MSERFGENPLARNGSLLLSIAQSLAFVFNVFKSAALRGSRSDFDIFHRDPSTSNQKQKNAGRK